MARSLSNSPPFSVYAVRSITLGTWKNIELRVRGGCKAWGYSSVARAVALQAIGLGFKSPYLQSGATAA